MFRLSNLVILLYTTTPQVLVLGALEIKEASKLAGEAVGVKI